MSTVFILRSVAALPATVLLAAPVQAQFSSWRSYEVGSPDQAKLPTDGRLADLNGDGALDLVATHWFQAPALSVALGDGHGGFEAAQHYPAAAANHLVLADLDGDGDVDVAVSEYGNNGEKTTVGLYRNQGDGSFTGPFPIPVGAGLQGLVAADLDGDGDQDLAVCRHGTLASPQNSIAVLLNQGAGSFSSTVTYLAADPSSLVGLSISPWRIEAGDMDGDGDTDLVVACSRQRLSVLLNSGSGTFAAPLTVAATGAIPDIDAGVALADVDGDGDLDVFYSSTETTVPSGSSGGGKGYVLFHNDGTGQLASPIGILPPTGTNGNARLASGDVTGDGAPDLVARFGDGWGVFANSGTGSFAPAGWLPTGEDPFAVRLGDVDSDGDLDVVNLCRGSLVAAVHLNTGNGDFSPPPSFLAGGLGNRHLDAGDVDGDGDVDVVVVGGLGGFGGWVDLLRNDGSGSFGVAQSYGMPQVGRNVKLRDLDGDSDLDLVWADDVDAPPYDLKTRINDGAGNFGPLQNWTVGTCGTWDLELVDVDGDGDLDAVLAEALACFGSFVQYLYVSRNDGSGAFGPPQIVAGDTTGLWGVAGGDLDGDGDNDLVATTTLGLVVLGNLGGGSFTPAVQISLPEGQREVALGDIDGDGDLDVVTQQQTSTTDPSVWVLRGNGDGSLAPAVRYGVAWSASFGASNLELVDVEADGDLDIVVSAYGPRDVTVLVNGGDGTFDQKRRYGGQGEVLDLAAADFTGDGAVDLVVLTSLAQDVFGSISGQGVGLIPSLAPWVDVGGGLAGSGGPSLLSGTGGLVTGAQLDLRLEDAPPGAPGAHVIGASTVDLPLFGGLLVPSPALLTPFVTDSQGAAALSATLGVVGSGLQLWVQSWFADAGGPAGFAASNAVTQSAP
ncbi:FG-GAP repeat domain-containing protein [Engelhardtia mirabilis]|uniref:FG-GAP repeat protein n=1 Tax=Engelhardtia mirabilis TaxID=2528011 RepID=A0A518BHQ2_9BACT|nr:FG-GAP repeat protein [Planctomycetes bacterium Pla133]QDV00810.1 FG-GAP repeat protein [Planctomycetes bacterium Pla86]